jgi:hypothetical protein
VVENNIGGKMAKFMMSLVLLQTVVVSVALRLKYSGYFIVVFGLLLFFFLIGHVIVQLSAIRNIPKREPTYPFLILLANIFFFLGFVLQADCGDGYCVVPLLAIFLNDPTSWAQNQFFDVGFYLVVSLLSLCALMITSSFLMKLEKATIPSQGRLKLVEPKKP